MLINDDDLKSRYAADRPHGAAQAVSRAAWSIPTASLSPVPRFGRRPMTPRTPTCPRGPDGLWPDNETFTADADGRFLVDGLKRHAQTTIHVIGPRTRPNVRLSTGPVLKDLTVEPGQVRDLGDVKVVAAAE